MTFRYPGGKKYKAPSEKTHKQRPLQHKHRFGNRGMTLEEDINTTNQYYIDTGRAVIHKKPTPVQVVHVDYPRRSAAKITEAYFKQPSTTDYNGIYRGKYIDFEAKESKNKTSFPFGNIHPHQAQHMKAVLKHGGIAFLLIRFSTWDKTYLYDASDFLWWYFDQAKRKSIPKKDIEQNGYEIDSGYQPRLDYLKAVDHFYF